MTDESGYDVQYVWVPRYWGSYTPLARGPANLNTECIGIRSSIRLHASRNQVGVIIEAQRGIVLGLLLGQFCNTEASGHILEKSRCGKVLSTIFSIKIVILKEKNSRKMRCQEALETISILHWFSTPRNARKGFPSSLMLDTKSTWIRVKKRNMFEDPVGTLKNSIWDPFLDAKRAPNAASKTSLYSSQLRFTMMTKKYTPPKRKPHFCPSRAHEHRVYASKKSMQNWYFFKTLLETHSNTFLNLKMTFFKLKREPKIEQKTVQRSFAANMQKCIEVENLVATRRVGPEASQGGLGGLLNTTY